MAVSVNLGAGPFRGCPCNKSATSWSLYQENIRKLPCFQSSTGASSKEPGHPKEAKWAAMTGP